MSAALADSKALLEMLEDARSRACWAAEDFLRGYATRDELETALRVVRATRAAWDRVLREALLATGTVAEAAA